MRRFYITFSGSAYNEQTLKALTALNTYRHGHVDEILVYDDRWLMETAFYQKNEWLWHMPPEPSTPDRRHRGFGWFCWKPFILLETLERMQDGDIVCFVDGDTYPIADFSVLYEECARIGGAMVFAAQGCSNRQWVKRDCLMIMSQDDLKWHDTQHCAARFMLFQKGPWQVRQFLMEWLTYCLNPNATTFEPSIYGPELPGFEQHRTEQAIFSMLVAKYGWKPYREACQFGDPAIHKQDVELYPTLFHQEWGSGPRTLDGCKYRNVSTHYL